MKNKKIKERRIWYYQCANCGKARRQSHKKAKARNAICQKCLKLKTPDGQESLFVII